MPRIRTTVAFECDVYEDAQSLSGPLGFRKMGDLVNEAVREYVSRKRTHLKDLQMEEAAADPEYRAALQQVSAEWAAADAQGLPDY